MDFLLAMTFSSCLVSIISSSSLTIFSPSSSPHPSHCVQQNEVYSFVKPAQADGGGGQIKEGGGGGGAGLLGQIHFQSTIFSFVFLFHFIAI